MKKGSSSSLRRGRFSEEGRIYHVTFNTHHRKPILAKLAVARLVVNVLKNESINTQTLAYVVMPDHVHWLLQLEHKSLNKTLHTVKSVSAKLINFELSRQGRVWQDGYHDHAVRKEEDLVDIARYIVMNPVRAGLVRSIREYSFWDAKWL